MPKTDDNPVPRIITRPKPRSRSSSRSRSSLRSREISADLMADLSTQEAAQPRRPENRGDPLGMKLLKQKLFPRRAQPVLIGRFNVLRLIGHGGMGAVYACYDEVLDRKVAVKILHLESSRGRDRELASARLVREGQALARLSHPNVVTVHEVGRSDEEVFVAMEFLLGDSLDVWVAQPRGWREILDVFIQAGRGVVAAHRVGIVHRDFKPQNVLVSEENLVKVLDFGLARASGEEVHEGLFASTSDTLNPGSSASTSELLRPLTLTGALVGTPAYMSPEQYRGELVTAASDQFSFCVSLYQCLYGVLPFSTSSLAELRAEVLAGRVSPAPPRSQVPSRIYRALRRGMSAQPASRYPSMKELLADLDWHKATRKRWIGAAVASTALAGLGGFLTADAASPTVEICPDAQAELAGVWDDAERELVTAAITSIDAPRIDGVLSIALPYLDQYANAWVHMRNEACHTHAEGRQADGLFDRRMACLDQRRAGLDALVEVFATATKPDHLNSLSQATFSLPPLDPCGDADALLAELAPPEDPDLRAQVQNHRENLARASMLNFAGELPQGLEIVETITKDDKALAYPPLVAEVYQQLGYLQWQNNQLKEAEESLERAMLTGIRIGHRSISAQASSRLAFLRAAALHELDRIPIDLPLVEALNERVRDDVDLYAESLNNIGWMRVLSGERQKGEALLVAADELRKKHNREQTPLALGTLGNLGYLALSDGQFEKMEQAFRAIATRSLDLFGPMALNTLEAERSVAWSLLELGRPRDAIEQLQILRHKADTVKNPILRAQSRYYLARSEFEEGNFSATHEYLTASLPLIPTEKYEYDHYLHQRMRASAASGDEAAMLDDYHQAKQRLGTLPDPIDYRRVMLLYHYGLALADLGRPEDAIGPLEQARSRLSTEVVAVEPQVPPRLSLALGHVYRNAGKLEAAQSALDQALVEFGNGWAILRADTHQELGVLALQRQQPEQAIALLNEACTLYATTAEPTYLPWARARYSLAKALTHTSEAVPEEARRHALAAQNVFRNSRQPELADEVATWLADHS